MKYDIKVTKLKNDEWSTKAFVSLTINDCFKVNGISIREAKNGNLFIAMPGYKTNKTDENGYVVYKNYCYPTNAEFRKELFDNIMKSYEGNGELVANAGDTKFEYQIQLFDYNGNSNIESIGRIKFNDCFAIDGVKVIDGSKGSFVSMPSKGTTGTDGKTEYNEICYPVTKEFRENLYANIIQNNSERKAHSTVDYAQLAQEIDDFTKDEGLPFR